ncbi:hypothetical protein WR25_03809 [Diploscapter pachys]|uniref:cyclin-dependent kinase n=1 Tax=Diploscapter pachys TaxID=2018661 RepID=A0A2A2J2E1_9BILA|nr:hypothetical protein WR25_03809 [Diploscapter pachys]
MSTDEGEIIEEEVDRVVVISEKKDSKTKIELELRSRLLGRISMPSSKHHDDDEEMFSLQPGDANRLQMQASSSKKSDESAKERRPISPPRFSNDRSDRDRDRRGTSSSHSRGADIRGIQSDKNTREKERGREKDKDRDRHTDRSPRDKDKDRRRERVSRSERDRSKIEEFLSIKEKERERGRDKHHKDKDKDRDRKRKKRNSSSDSNSSPEPKHHSKDKEKVSTPKPDELFGDKRKRTQEPETSKNSSKHSSGKSAEKDKDRREKSESVEKGDSPMEVDVGSEHTQESSHSIQGLTFPSKYSKFESSPEPELEDDGRRSSTPFNQDDAVDIDSDPDPDLDDEMLDEADKVAAGISENNPLGYDFDPDSVQYEDLTEEQKVMLTPDTKKRLEADWQKRLIADLPVYYPGIMGCRSILEFDCVNRIEEGTYGVVYRGKDKRNDEIVALKRLKMEKEKEGFPITALREINMLLKAGSHENIVNVREILIGTNMDKIYLSMEFIEHDMKSLMDTMHKKNKRFTMGEQKTLMIQLLRGLNHMHNLWILHRDLKTSNLLLSHKGVLKIADFGLAREYGDPLKPYTPIVVTLWYRAPELLLGRKLYSTPIDLWSVGCMMAEFILLKPLLPGKGETDQIEKIFHELGTPSEAIWPGFSELPYVKNCAFPNYQYNQLRKKFPANQLNQGGWELLNKFMTYDPEKRITASQALEHQWFKDDPKPTSRELFPTFPAKSEQHKAPPPSQARQPKVVPTEIVDPETAKLMKELNVKPEQIKPSSFALKFDKNKFGN